MPDYVLTALLAPPFAELTYERLPWFPVLAPGHRVLVPMRGRVLPAVVLGEAPTPEFATKPLLWPLEAEPLLGPDYLELARDVARRQALSVGRILGTLLPLGLRTEDVSFAIDKPPFPKSIAPKHLSTMHEDDRAALMRAFMSGTMRVVLSPRLEARETVVRLAQDPPWPVRPNARRQISLLEYLLENGPQSQRSLTAALGAGVSGVVERLVGLDLLELGHPEELPLLEQTLACPAPEDAIVTSQEQKAALDLLLDGFDADEPRTVLVHGVTGSGKTHLYLELVERCLSVGRSAVLLAPEVALACGLFRAARQRFPEADSMLYHGYLTPRDRRDAFVHAGKATGPVLVTGTRSALFLPLKDIGLIVVDEEHDESFKQEERLAYQAKEVAWLRVKQSKGLLVLGSATPDIKTRHAVDAGAVPVVEMVDRVGGGSLPSVELADMSSITDPETPLAETTLAALLQIVEAGEQAMIMLNRRGYAPLMYCLDCGEAVRCPECQVGMTYHKGRERLVCHYCGLSYPFPVLCSGCGGNNYLPMGGGTERLEESIRKALGPDVPVLRMDRDSTRRQERMEAILEDFRQGRAQVLVGTQMLSKGHHFPNVTLVVVADGDLGLNLPDYRSSERTFQLLVQVSGRAGRGERPGRVLIQTRNPRHPFWAHVLAGDYHAFYAGEIARRRQFGYPPFVKLGLARLSYPADFSEGPALIGQAAKLLREQAKGLGVTVLGPAQAPLGMLRGRKRFNCLFKSQDWPAIRGLYELLNRWNPHPGTVRIGLDLDPVNML